MAESSEQTSPTAAEILRPALMLWLLTWVAVGAMNHVWLLCDPVWDEPSIGMLVWVWGYDVVFAVLVVWFVRCDREAWRVFRRPRPRMIELCVVVGIGASLLFNMWHGLLPGVPSAILWEHAAGCNVQHQSEFIAVLVEMRELRLAFVQQNGPGLPLPG